MEQDRHPQPAEHPAEVTPVGASSRGEAIDYGAEAARNVAQAGRQMASFMEHLAEAATAEGAVGPAHTVQGHTVVPLAVVSVQGGFGLGFGGGGGGVDPNRNQGGGSGGGGGGGGRSSARVIAVADISDSGVVVRPVPDVTKLALGMMALIGLRMLSRRGAGGADRAARRGLLRLLGRP